jgi:hypothetical protein
MGADAILNEKGESSAAQRRALWIARHVGRRGRRNGSFVLMNKRDVEMEMMAWMRRVLLC